MMCYFSILRLTIGNGSSWNFVEKFVKRTKFVNICFECDTLHNRTCRMCKQKRDYQTYQHKELRERLTFHSMGVVQAIFNLISSSEKFFVYFSKLTISWQRIAEMEKYFMCVYLFLSMCVCACLRFHTYNIGFFCILWWISCSSCSICTLYSTDVEARICQRTYTQWFHYIVYCLFPRLNNEKSTNKVEWRPLYRKANASTIHLLRWRSPYCPHITVSLSLCLIE